MLVCLVVHTGTVHYCILEQQTLFAATPKTDEDMAAPKGKGERTDPDDEDAALPSDGDGLPDGRENGLAGGQRDAAHCRVHEFLLQQPTPKPSDGSQNK